MKAVKVGKKSYRIYQPITDSEKMTTKNSVVISYTDDKRSERLVRKIIKQLEG